MFRAGKPIYISEGMMPDVIAGPRPGYAMAMIGDMSAEVHAEDGYVEVSDHTGILGLRLDLSGAEYVGLALLAALNEANELDCTTHLSDNAPLGKALSVLREIEHAHRRKESPCGGEPYCGECSTGDTSTLVRWPCKTATIIREMPKIGDDNG